MTFVTIGLSAGTLLAMAVVLTAVLGWANKKFHVEVDKRVLSIIDALPGANCGGCGYVGCGEYAEAVALEHEAVNKCTVGGQSCALAGCAIASRKFWWTTRLLASSGAIGPPTPITPMTNGSSGALNSLRTSRMKWAMHSLYCV